MRRYADIGNRVDQVQPVDQGQGASRARDLDFADADLVFDDRPAPGQQRRRAAGLYAAVPLVGNVVISAVKPKVHALVHSHHL
jgi:hypothetical protein